MKLDSETQDKLDKALDALEKAQEIVKSVYSTRIDNEHLHLEHAKDSVNNAVFCLNEFLYTKRLKNN